MNTAAVDDEEEDNRLLEDVRVPFHEMPTAKCTGQNTLVDAEDSTQVEAAADTHTVAVDTRDSLLQEEDAGTLHVVAVASDDSLHQTIQVVLTLEVCPVLRTTNTLDEALEDMVLLSIRHVEEAVLVDTVVVAAAADMDANDSAASKSLEHEDCEDSAVRLVLPEIQIQDLRSPVTAAVVAFDDLGCHLLPWPTETRLLAFGVSSEQEVRILDREAAAAPVLDTVPHVACQNDTLMKGDNE